MKVLEVNPKVGDILAFGPHRNRYRVHKMQISDIIIEELSSKTYYDVSLWDDYPIIINLRYRKTKLGKVLYK